MALPKSFRCPTIDEVLRSAIALLPRGRAWQTHETGPMPGSVPGFDPDSFDNESFATERRAGSVLWSFWYSVAQVITFLTTRLCALRLEFWCATQTETNDLWLQEYGLPDDCDPFPDLCTKVAAVGGTRCEYYQAIAGRAGWDITCADVLDCGARAGSGLAKAGIAKPGRADPTHIEIQVNIGNSSAYTGTLHAKPKAGRLKAGRRLACGPSIATLECLLSRVVHAQIQIKYRTIPT